MSMISYAQNMEDVLLARVFDGQETGFYIDVGAWDPEKDSVTKHFYNKGWHGVNIEPAREYYDVLSLDRKRDINLHVALGKTPGERPFYEFSREGISTLDKELADSFAGKGYRCEKSRIEVKTLAAVCEEYASEIIDFLKIDVEGLEEEVIRGADWTRFRPRVLVIEAVDPLNHSSQWEVWEPFLLENGYLFAYFDGINRFYIRNEEPGLSKYFSAPPGILDNFQTHKHVLLQKENKILEQQHFALQQHLVDLQRQTDNLNSALDSVRGEAANAINYARGLEAQIHSMASSRSFRLGFAIRRATRPVAPAVRPGIRLIRRAKRAALHVRHWLTTLPVPRRKAVIAGRYRQAVAPGQIYSFNSAGSLPGHQGRAPLGEICRAVEADKAGRGNPEKLATALEKTGHDDENVLLERRIAVNARDAIVQAGLYQCIREAEDQKTKKSFQRSAAAGVVVVDARCLQDPNYRSRGVGRHAGHVLEVLADGCRGKNGLALLVDPALPDLAPEIAALGKYSAASFDARALDDVALFVELSPMTASPGPALAFLIDPHIRSVAVLFDFIPDDFAGQYLDTDERWITYAARLAALGRYDSFLAISESTAEELRQKLGRDVSVVATGVANHLQLAKSYAGNREPAVPPFDSYILAASGADARKNLLAAIAALAHATRFRKRNLGLVVSGSFPSEMVEAANNFARMCGLGSERLSFCSGLDDEQLKELYARAEAVLVPSFAEGFSIPVIEAVAAGTPVIASDIPAHRELLGEGWWYSPPANPLALSKNLTRALSDPAVLHSQQQEAIADRFTVKAVSNRIRDALSRKMTELERKGKSGPMRPAKGRPRLAVITPFPPQQSGVAAYSAFTMDAVAKHADVVIYTDRRIKTIANKDIELRHYSVEPYLDPGFDAVISVMGNSHFHIPVMENFREFGGACIAHDPRMVEFYDFWRGPETLAAMFSRHAEEPVLPEDLPPLISSLDGLPSLAYDEIARRARPMLVHASGIASGVLRETGIEPVVLPYVPHHLPAINEIGPETVRAAREKLGMSEDAAHVVTFGILDQRTKATDVILDAIAWMRQWGMDCHIHYVGSDSHHEKKELLRRARNIGVESAVHLTGWVDFSHMDDYLLAADAAVQLRTFSHAPLSGALLDCMAFGVPSVATESLAAEMVAPPFVRGLPGKFSGLLLAEKLAAVLESRRTDALPVIENERRQWLAQRTADLYARRLLEALDLVSLS